MSAEFMSGVKLHPTRARAKELQQNCALFLDIDGTLLEIASRPDAVVVPDNLVSLLARTSSWLGGALALVSGRPLAQIDALMSPLELPCAAEHGAVIRLPDGTIESAEAIAVVPQSWRRALLEATKHWRGVLLEPKTYGVAVHFRQAPERENEVRRVLEELLATGEHEFEMLPASMAFELRCRRLTKAAPVFRFMASAPFAGRQAVFVGDDVTDHDGFRAVESLKGVAIDVHEAFGGKPSEVLRWLDSAPRAER